eukprot:94647-Pyramimonas_sp.AAC.1
MTHNMFSRSARGTVRICDALVGPPEGACALAVPGTGGPFTLYLLCLELLRECHLRQRRLQPRPLLLEALHLLIIRGG